MAKKSFGKVTSAVQQMKKFVPPPAGKLSPPPSDVGKQPPTGVASANTERGGAFSPMSYVQQTVPTPEAGGGGDGSLSSLPSPQKIADVAGQGVVQDAGDIPNKNSY